MITIIIFLSTTFQINAQQPQSFAVMELYTSQGCSSCPSAEEFMSALLEHEYYAPLNIIAIAEHVTYWDKLGWKDLYGQYLFDTRQNQYRQKFNETYLVTPQFVISGAGIAQLTSEDIQNRVQASLDEKRSVGVSVSLASYNGNEIEVEYEISGLDQPKHLIVVVVEDSLKNYISAGENAGKTLTHDRVARVFQIFPYLEGKGKVTVTLPEDINRRYADVQAIVQDGSSMEMYAATKGFSLAGTSIVQEGAGAAINLFPNPASEYVRLNFTGLEGELLRVEFINLMGSAALSFGGVAGGFSSDFDIGTLPPGIYRVKISSSAGTVIAVESLAVVR